MFNSVTGRINEIKQPRGGYVNPSLFRELETPEYKPLNENENLEPNIIGMVVDYLTRGASGQSVGDAFGISLEGAQIAEQVINGSVNTAVILAKGINGLDDKSIINACKLVSFDIWKRNPLIARSAKTYKDINPDEATIENIHTLVMRSLIFLGIVKPVVSIGFTFNPPHGTQKQYDKMIKTGKGSFGGYTPTVASGDGDYIARNTIWDFKVSKNKPTSKHTLQLLMYWIMGQHSGQDIFIDVDGIGIFNPRLHTMYRIPMSSISEEIIHTVEKEVIGY